MIDLDNPTEIKDTEISSEEKAQLRREFRTDLELDLYHFEIELAKATDPDKISEIKENIKLAEDYWAAVCKKIQEEDA